MASRLLNREYRLEDTTLESTDTFTYDDVSRVLTAAKGRYSNTCTYTYDEIGRRKTEKTTVGGNDYTITHTYDADNRITNCQYPNGDNVAKTWTDRNQLESVKFNAASIIDSTYDDGMRESTRTFGNNLVNTMTYNLDNTRDAISVAGKTDLSFSYGYDANKNVTDETSTGTVMDDYSFTADFDDKDRVDDWDRSNGDSQDWTLDLIGNWGNTTGTLDGSSFNENRTHNDVHELTDMGGNSVQYDAKGNMTNDAWLNALSWDIDNHLSAHGVITFTYDALGRRLEKKTSTGNMLYICNGQRVVEEHFDDLLGGGYILSRSYVYGSYVDDVVAKIENGSTLYYHSDRQFNVRGLTDSTGAVRELYAYSVYGKQIILDAAGTVQIGTAENNYYGYTGRYLDSETGLWYFRARYFSDEMGRFINRDPLGYVDGMSLYNGHFAKGFGLDPNGTVLDPVTNYKHYSKYQYGEKRLFGYKWGTFHGGWGSIYHRHHWLPSEHRKAIEKKCPGLDIDRFVTPVHTDIHSVIHHKIKWNDYVERILQRSKDCCEFVTTMVPASILTYASIMAYAKAKISLPYVTFKTQIHESGGAKTTGDFLALPAKYCTDDDDDNDDEPKKEKCKCITYNSKYGTGPLPPGRTCPKQGHTGYMDTYNYNGGSRQINPSGVPSRTPGVTPVVPRAPAIPVR